MPEGDSVHRVCAALDRALAGGELRVADLRVPRLATRDLVGWRITEVRPRGKHLLIRLSAPDAREGLTLHSHLMMEGRWQIDTALPGVELGPWRSPGHQARVVLEVEHEDGSTARGIAFEVQQVDLVRTAEEDQLVGHLGPDLLEPAWDDGMREEAVRRLAADPERTLGVALLDQTRLAGIGNVYRSELCFLSRVHPSISVGEFADRHDLPALVDLAQRLLFVNRDRVGRVTTGGMMGRRADLWVYGRAGQRCLRCGARIERSYLADPEAPEHQDRSIYICPHCQEGGPPAAGAPRGRPSTGNRGAYPDRRPRMTAR